MKEVEVEVENEVEVDGTCSPTSSRMCSKNALTTECSASECALIAYHDCRIHNTKQSRWTL